MIALTELPGTRRKAGPDLTSVTSPAPTKPQRTAPRLRRAAKAVTGRSALLVGAAREADDLVGDVLDRLQHGLTRGLARAVGGDEVVHARGGPGGRFGDRPLRVLLDPVLGLEPPAHRVLVEGVDAAGGHERHPLLERAARALLHALGDGVEHVLCG